MSIDAKKPNGLNFSIIVQKIALDNVFGNCFVQSEIRQILGDDIFNLGENAFSKKENPSLTLLGE